MLESAAPTLSQQKFGDRVPNFLNVSAGFGGRLLFCCFIVLFLIEAWHFTAYSYVSKHHNTASILKQLQIELEDI